MSRVDAGQTIGSRTLVARNAVLTLLTAVLLAATGCVDGKLNVWEIFKPEFWGKEGPNSKVQPSSAVSPMVNSLAVRSTVASYAYFEGMRMMRVRGYGLVAGLGDRGSKECPRQVRDRLVQEIIKKRGVGVPGALGPQRSPEEIVDSQDTAVVLVQGEIPSAATRGTRFDIQIRALEGTQTTSLEGGTLYTCDLHYFRADSDRTLLEGDTLATAQGPIFINPFADEPGSATQVNPRRGLIVGGGKVLVSRKIRLDLVSPSYQLVRRIARRINDRFSPGPKVADPLSPGRIQIAVPPGYVGREDHFLQLVRHLYVPEEAGFAERRTRQLAKEILDPQSPHNDIGLAWESIGRTVIPAVRKLYGDRRAHVNYFAARTGLRLGDVMAVDVLADHARNTRSPYRMEAIHELGRATHLTSAAGVLRELLSDTTPQVRVLAYEMLRKSGDEAIRTYVCGKSNFALDVIDAAGEFLIYCKRTEQQRIALFGKDLTCTPPLFYAHHKGDITISSNESDKQLTLIRKTPFHNLVGTTQVDLNAINLIKMLGDDPQQDRHENVTGLGLTYSHVVHALNALCRDGGLPANFMFEAPSLSDYFGPLDKSDRPESELE